MSWSVSWERSWSPARLLGTRRRSGLHRQGERASRALGSRASRSGAYRSTFTGARRVTSRRCDGRRTLLGSTRTSDRARDAAASNARGEEVARIGALPARTLGLERSALDLPPEARRGRTVDVPNGPPRVVLPPALRDVRFASWASWREYRDERGRSDAFDVEAMRRSSVPSWEEEARLATHAEGLEPLASRRVTLLARGSARFSVRGEGAAHVVSERAKAGEGSGTSGCASASCRSRSATPLCSRSTSRTRAASGRCSASRSRRASSARPWRPSRRSGRSAEGARGSTRAPTRSARGRPSRRSASPTETSPCARARPGSTCGYRTAAGAA